MLFFAKNHFPTQNLLAHAEVGEDFAEDLVGGDLAGDFIGRYLCHFLVQKCEKILPWISWDVMRYCVSGYAFCSKRRLELLKML